MRAAASAPALALAAALAAAAPPAAARQDPFADRWIETGAARLEALDKITGRVSVLVRPLEAPARFGTLEIRVRACHRRPPELPPDSAAFLEIDEPGRAGDEPLFRGWMFASSPGLSPLEHPVYDVVVLDCVAAPDTAASSGSQSDGAAAAGSE